MIKGLNILLMIISFFALIGVYALKYQTVDVANGQLALERKIETQQGHLSLLHADWAYLNQPVHIEPIVTRFSDVLQLQNLVQEQFISIDDLPMRPATTPDDEALTALFEALEAGIDPIAVLIEASSL